MFVILRETPDNPVPASAVQSPDAVGNVSATRAPLSTTGAAVPPTLGLLRVLTSVSWPGWGLPATPALPPGEATWAKWPHRYIARWGGVPGKRPPPKPAWHDIAYIFLLIFVGMVACLAPHYGAVAMGATDAPLILISSAASALLIYGAPQSPLAQPRNVIAGHMLGAIVGVGLREAILPRSPPYTVLPVGALAVALSTALMLTAGVLHPPGGATALIAVVGVGVTNAGWMWVLNPVLVTALILVAIALVFNNLLANHRYPLYW